MRVSHPAMLLSLATLIICVASPAMARRPMPMASYASDDGAYADDCGATCEGQYADCEQCAAPMGIFEQQCGCECGPTWSFAAEGIALQRTNSRHQPLLTGLDSQIIDTIDATNMEFSVATGYQLSAIRHDVFGTGCDFEIAYFQVDGFAARSHMPGPSMIVTDVNETGIYVDDAEACYKSALYNGELNLRGCCTDWLTLLVGVRMVELDEHFSAGGTLGDGELPALAPISLSSRLFQVNTYNHLYGIQLGGEAEVYNMGGPLQVRASCKAGVYDNAAFQNYRTVAIDLFDPAYGADRDQAAFLGEAGVVATYALTQRLAFRASATAMWITGVALAPEQIHAVDLRSECATIDTVGTVFYYGGGLGLEYRF